MANAGEVMLDSRQTKKWENRRKELEARHDLAGIFRGWIPAGYFTYGKPRILYVGKATSGKFDGPHDERESFNGAGAFWDFARQIANGVGCEEEGIPCLAWSNISKISVIRIKAEVRMIGGFEDQAVSTLKYEIQITRPNIVVFVTNHFSDEVVQKIAEAPDNGQWNKSENESTVVREHDIWWRRRADGLAILWMRHPMGAHKLSLVFAADKIVSLVRSS